METNIIGAGGLAREIASWIKGDSHAQYKINGYWDDNLQALQTYEMDLKVLGKAKELQSGNFLMGIMDPFFKQSILEYYSSNPNVQVLQYIHSSVLVGERTLLGEAVILFPNVIVSCDVKIGQGTFINLGSQIGHDVTIGNFVSIMPNVDLGGGCIIEDNVFIGSGATLLPGVKVPKNTRIGAGSVVVKSIKKEGTYFGNPAKKIF